MGGDAGARHETPSGTCERVDSECSRVSCDSGSALQNRKQRFAQAIAELCGPNKWIAKISVVHLFDRTISRDGQCATAIAIKQHWERQSDALPGGMTGLGLSASGVLGASSIVHLAIVSMRCGSVRMQRRLGSRTWKTPREPTAGKAPPFGRPSTRAFVSGRLVPTETRGRAGAGGV
jgi:hypothetical protein